MAPADASVAYKRLLNEISRYLEEMEAPRAMIDAMVATSSSEIRWVDDYHDGLKRPPSIAEWTDASCGSFTEDENDTWQRLLNKRNSPGLTANEQMLLQFLGAKVGAHTMCKSNLFRSHVDRLPTPYVAEPELPTPAAKKAWDEFEKSLEEHKKEPTEKPSDVSPADPYEALIPKR